MKFYITTSIAYTNAGPHIGFALESIQADVLARYHRISGDDVFFLTGTDEHGVKVVKAAEKEGKTPIEFVDGISAKFEELKEILNLSNDYFIRTTDRELHWPAVQEIWSKIKEKGDIYKKKYKGLYCVGCEAFIMKKDLIDGKCLVHQKEPEIVEEENYFFRLSKYQKEISKAIKEDKIIIIPEAKKNEMMTFIEQGLEDISFSRSSKNLTWGIPVPEDESQTIYVWADALTNYISALGKNFKNYWPPDVQCIGKDISKFHCLIWPGMLLSLGLPLPKKILIHGFINIAGQKMSKSLGNIIDPIELVKKYGTDTVRYFLLREMPTTQDGDFTYEKFEERYKADLAKGLGNLTARIITLANKLSVNKNDDNVESALIKQAIEEAQQECNNSLQQLKFNDSLVAIWKLIGVCDKYIEQTKPWEQSDNQKTVIKDLLIALNHIAKILEPFLPQTSVKILKQIKEAKGEILFPQL